MNWNWAVIQKKTRSAYRVDFIDPFPALVALPAHPVAVEVSTDPIEHFTGEPVILPLLCVELQNALVHQILSILKTSQRNLFTASLNRFNLIHLIVSMTLSPLHL